MPYEYVQEGVLLGVYGYCLLKEGLLEECEEKLTKSLRIKQKAQNKNGIPELLSWFAILFVVKAKKAGDAQSDLLKEAENCCCDCIKVWFGKNYYKNGALTTLVLIKHAQAEYGAIPALLAEAEALAQQYEYNDHLASLRLTQGTLAWDGHAADGAQGFAAALGHYRQALVYALRFNRFLLDEVLWGGGVATPLQPLIPTCLGRGAAGRQMLTALRDWWQTGTNSTGTPRPDTISPLAEDSPLLEAERLAREREPGDGTPQHLVVAKIEEALRS